MSACVGQRSKAGVGEGGIESRISDIRDNKSWSKMSRRGAKMAASASEKRRNAKIHQIRQQLTDGKYDTSKRLNGVLDKLLEVLVT
jgi:anti-sigma28 factor (negative regulator of flagellin synthesis)